MVKSEASLNDVDDDQISLSRLEDQNMKSDEFIVHVRGRGVYEMLM